MVEKSFNWGEECGNWMKKKWEIKMSSDKKAEKIFKNTQNLQVNFF